MEQIIIQGLQVETLIGVYDWERTRPTKLQMDITVDADLSRAMVSDDVEHTIDYAALASHVQQVAGNTQFELLEALGHALMENILAAYPAQRVTLSITKPGILKDARQVTVKMSRARSE